MRYAIALFYVGVFVLNFLVATMYFQEGKDTIGAIWSVTAGLWLGGALIWASGRDY